MSIFEFDLGIESPIFLNNSYSKNYSPLFIENGTLRIIRFLSKEKKIGIGFNIYSYNHEIRYDSVVPLIQRNGVEEFGKIWANHFDEWRFGTGFHYSANINEKHYFFTTISAGVILSYKSFGAFEYEPNMFATALPIRNNGKFADLEVGYLFNIATEDNWMIGFVYEICYGKIATNFDVSYGMGKIIDIHDSYNYNQDYIIFRQRFALKTRIDLTFFYEEY